MSRFDPRALVLVPVITLVTACAGGPEPPAPVSPSSATASAAVPEPSDSVFVEEDPDPTTAPGDLSDEAQSYLDRALGIELEALQQAPTATAEQKRKILDGLPDNPSQVLDALKNYDWQSPEAEALYDQAVEAG